MNKTPVNEDSLNRLAKTLMVRHHLHYQEALEMLETFQLNIVCHKSLTGSQSNQAALLTAINTGKRAFPRGVSVSMPPNVQCALNWPNAQTLNEVASSLGASLTSTISHSPTTQTLYIGHTPRNPVEEGLIVTSSGWRGGVLPVSYSAPILGGNDFATGGVAAGSLGVALSFLRLSGLSSRPLESPQGISLWRPDLDWLSDAAEGPQLEVLPQNVWVLGLGHLGQAYLWNFGLLPYANTQDAHFVLQDFDKVVEANYSSQLLTEKENVGTRKTRISCQWLEARGFNTTLEERPFDENTKRSGDEPYIACCGFDAAEPRRLLENAGFDFVVECALGSDAARFDRIITHTFPDGGRKATDIWSSTPPPALDQSLVQAFQTQNECGVLAETLARKSIATAFVGAFAGAIVVGEILKAFHGGLRSELIQLQLRQNERPSVVSKVENYLNRVARSGFNPAVTRTRMAA